jgi:tryptophan halogenase
MIKHICVVGGGTAGWMSAAYLSKKGFDVTLVESKNIPLIGVGESTLPAMTTFCRELGLNDTDWMHKVQSVHKLGICHKGWKKGSNTDWWHWFEYDRNKHDAKHEYIKNETLPDSIFEYAYHIDAIKFGNEICKPIALENNCTHIIDDVISVPTDSTGITHILTKDNGSIIADFYIDCTGFAKVLAKEVGITYKNFEHVINDRAIACPQESLDKINRFTITRKMSSGWCWEIALQNRRGAGYVYSSKYITDDAAVKEYIDLYPNTNREKLRILKFNPEYTENPIYKNCAAIGLSSGFLEPLEATSIWLIQYFVEGLYKTIKADRNPKVFNKAQLKVMHEIYYFILCHYTLSDHDDTEYWKYYKELEKKLNTKDYVKSMALEKDSTPEKYTKIFHPYSWWSMDKFLN